MSLPSWNHHAQGLANDKTAEHAVINPTRLPWEGVGDGVVGEEGEWGAAAAFCKAKYL